MLHSYEFLDGPKDLVNPASWERTQIEDGLDDWPKVDHEFDIMVWADQEFNAPGRHTERCTFWNWFNSQLDLFRERLALKDHATVDLTLDAMQDLDTALRTWNSRTLLFRDTPSFIKDLMREQMNAINRDFKRKPVSEQLALGEFVKVRLKGVIHILPKEALVEFPQLKEMVV